MEKIDFRIEPWRPRNIHHEDRGPNNINWALVLFILSVLGLIAVPVAGYFDYLTELETIGRQ